MRKDFHRGWVACWVLGALCLWSVPAVAAKGSVTYFVGQSKTARASTPNKYLRTIRFLVKREVLPRQNRIIETIYQRGTTHRTILTRIGTSHLFVATDARRSFVGTVEYRGTEAWKWRQWTYRIVLTRPGLLMIGQGQLDAKGMTTRKRLLTSTARVLFLVGERLRTIPQATFSKMLAASQKGKPKSNKPKARLSGPLQKGKGPTRAFPLQVVVMTSTKKPLTGAIVRVGQKVLGFTNRFGTLKGNVQGKVGQELIVTVIGRGANNFVQVKTRLALKRSVTGVKTTRAVKVEAFLRPWNTFRRSSKSR